MPTVYYDSSNNVVADEAAARAAGGYVVYDSGGSNPVRVDLAQSSDYSGADGGKLLGTFDPVLQTFDASFVQSNPPSNPGDYFRVIADGANNVPFTGIRLYIGDELVATSISDPLTASQSDWAVRRGSFVRTAVQADIDAVVDTSTAAPSDRVIWTPEALQSLHLLGGNKNISFVTAMPEAGDLDDYKESDYVVVQPGYGILSGMVFQHAGASWTYIGQSQLPVVNFNPATTDVAARLTYPQLFYWLRIDTDGGVGDDVSGIYVLSSQNEVSGPFAMTPTNPVNTFTNTAP